MPACLCGCGEQVPRRFKPGHDARMKSRLFAAAREGDQAAKDEIVAQGWWHLYDKTAPKPVPQGTIKQKAAHYRRQAQEARTEPDPEYVSAKKAERQVAERAAAAAKLEKLNLMKAAAQVLREAFPDRTKRAGLHVTADNAQQIIDIGPVAADLLELVAHYEVVAA